MEHTDVLANKKFDEKDTVTVVNIKTDCLTQATYYMLPGQTLPWHRHPEGDQIFFTHEGVGVCSIDSVNGEESIRLAPGVVALAPKGVWHRIEATTRLVVSAATSQPAGFEKR